MTCSRVFFNCKLVWVFIIVTANITECKEIHLTQNGNDTKACGPETSPCLTLKYALQKTSWNDMVLITAFRDARDSIVSSNFCLNDWAGHEINKNLTIKGIKGRPIIDCNSKDGSALFYVSGKKSKSVVTFVVENLQVQNVEVSAVSIDDNTHIKAKDCKFSKMLYAFGMVSGLLTAKTLVLEVQQSVFNDCSSAISVASLRLKIGITDCWFLGDKKWRSNVGLSVRSGQPPIPKATDSLEISIARSTFKWNRFSITLQELSRNTSVSITESEFESNAATGLHGFLDKGAVLYVLYAVLADENVTIEMRDSIIKSNEANVGGAIHIDIFKSDPSFDDSGNHVRVSFDKVNFVNNTAQQVGGAVFASTSITNNKFEFISCNFQSNRVEATSKVGRLSTLFFPAMSGTGGAIYFAKGNLLLDNCTFSNNTATIFGGAIAATAKTTIQNSIINGSISKINARVNGRLVYLTREAILRNVTMNAVISSEAASDLWYQSTDKDTDLAVEHFEFKCSSGAAVRSEKIKSYSNSKNYYILQYHCRHCPIGTYSLQAGQEKVNGAEIQTTNPACIRCPYGATCHNQISAMPNFWGFKRTDELRFKMCPRSYCCQKNCQNISKCAPGRTGRLCGRCVKSHSENLFNTNCSVDTKCNNWWIMIAVPFISIAYVCFFLYLNDIIQALSRVIWPFSERRGENSLNDSLIKRPETQENQSKDENYIQSLTIIVCYFYQLQFLLNIEGISELDDDTYRVKQVIIDAFSIQSPRHLITGCPFPGLTPVTKKLFISLFNVYIYLIMIFIYIVVCVKSRISKVAVNERFVARLCRASVTLILLNFTYMGNTALMFLNCQDVSGGLVLFMDGEITCFQSWQYVVIAYVILFIAPVTLVLLFGVEKVKKKRIPIRDFMISLVFPLALPLSLILTKHSGNERDTFKDNPAFKDNVDRQEINQSPGIFDALTPPRSPRVANENEEITNNQISDILCQSDEETNQIPTATTEDCNGMMSDSASDLNRAHEAALQVLAKPYLKDDDTGPIYWEGILLLRRLSIVVLSVMVQNKVIFLYLSLLLLVIALFHHHWIQPFRSKIANALETVSLILLSVLSAINLFYAHYMMDDLQLNEGAKSIAYVFDWITFAIAVAVPFSIIMAALIALLIKIGLASYRMCKRT